MITAILVLFTSCATAVDIAWTDSFNRPSASTQSARASVGDEVIFTWTGYHNVYLMPNEQALTACDFSQSINLGARSPVSYAVTEAGPLYFGCQVGSHCKMGQHVTVSVAAPAPAPELEMLPPCPMASCMMPPRTCPAGSHRGNVNWAKICGGEHCCGSVDCGGCVSDVDDTQYVEVPYCMQNIMACPMFMCRDGEEVVEVTPAGANGEAPCCPEYECRTKPTIDLTPIDLTPIDLTPIELTPIDLEPLEPCPVTRCMMPPRTCPAGSHRGNVNWDKICGGEHCCGTTDCGGCVSDADDTRYVEVPYCMRNAMACPMVRCSPDQMLVKVTAAGANGAEPCCDEYTCEDKEILIIEPKGKGGKGGKGGKAGKAGKNSKGGKAGKAGKAGKSTVQGVKKEVKDSVEVEDSPKEACPDHGVFVPAVQMCVEQVRMGFAIQNRACIGVQGCEVQKDAARAEHKFFASLKVCRKVLKRCS